jgi:putative transcriptional regulator
MKTVRMNIDPSVPSTLKAAHVDLARVDATTEDEIQAQIVLDDQEAMRATKALMKIRKRAP